MDEQEIPGAAKSKAKADDVARQNWIRVKNRRKRYLDTHPEYFGPELELADPILYDRLVCLHAAWSKSFANCIGAI